MAVPVVGIGASAGGVEALSRFFDAMPADSGSAFVVVLHLDPSRESEMAHVLSTHTEMPVTEVEHGVKVASNHVYVIAPNNYLKLRGGRLQLSEPTEPRGHRYPVDVLFASLAEDQRERAVAIVLSGTGSNGTEGLKEVKGAGGLILVQDPKTAKFGGMPRSAIAAGVTDRILAPEEMPEFLLQYLRHAYMIAPDRIEAAGDGQTTLDQILELVRIQAGHDFRDYKGNTLHRRVHRRMGLKHLATLDEYAKELRARPEEVAELANDLMIGVTGFFRDADAWKALAELVIAPLVANRESGAALRLWVPCCSTGEEAYTVAMLMTDQAEAAGKQFDLKIFATDAMEGYLRKARDGIYPQAAAATLSGDRLRRFFDKLDGSYQVKKDLRDLVVFAPQNLLHDPPFSRMDLISCRNLLIYLEPEAQQRIIALSHFGLREGGHLFLGSAETVGRQDDLFETISKKWRIYRRLGPMRHDIVDFPLQRGLAQRQDAPEHSTPSGPAAQRKEPTVHPADLARRALLERYAPASVLIDQRRRVLYFHGETGDYLEHPTGEPTRDLIAMAREGLGAKLRAGVREALSTNRGLTVRAGVRRRRACHPVVVTITPLPASAQGGSHLLVSFEPEPGATSPSPPATARGDAGPATSGERALQDELNATRAELRSTIEHLEAANEELNASNEEITSMNEELQSTNEELETSKEELQSFNEELHTVNNQLQSKVRELEDITNDLNNLLAGSETATLFLDTNLTIKWFTPAIKELFDLVPSDIGRPMAHFARKFDDENLLPDAETVLKKLTSVEAEVRSSAGRWYMRRMLPYRTQDNRIAGVVITFTDITDRKRSADAIDEARIYSEAIVETVRQPLLIMNGDLRVVSGNPAFYELFQVDEAETEGHLVYDLVNGEWDIPQLRTLLDEVLSADQPFADMEVEHHFADIGRRYILLSGRKIAREGSREEMILLAIEDITERRQGQEALRRSEAQYRMLFESIDEGFCVIEKTDTAPGAPIDFQYLSANPAFERQTGVSDVVGKTIREAFPGEPQEWFDTYDSILKSGEPIRFERDLGTKERVLDLYAFRLEDNTQRRVAVIFQDITGRRRAEHLTRWLASIVESSDDAIISKNIDGIITSWNRGAKQLLGYTAEEMIGKSITAIIPPDRSEEEDGIIERIRRDEHINHFETVRQHNDGNPVWVSMSVSPLKNADGRVIGASTIARDITERRDADEHRKMLIGELNHRVKNILATVQAIASRTLGGAASVEEARHAFGSRLTALAGVHDLLTREEWHGAELGDLVREMTGPFSGNGRFQIDGPRVRLPASAVVLFGMTLHELSTNAAKYGALSNEEGHIDIFWGVVGNGGDRRLHLRWTESGGPPVSKPTRKGFGSRLIERGLAAELGAEVKVEYEPSGVVCAIDAPLPGD